MFGLIGVPSNPAHVYIAFLLLETYTRSCTYCMLVYAYSRYSLDGLCRTGRELLHNSIASRQGTGTHIVHIFLYEISHKKPSIRHLQINLILGLM